MTTKRTFIDFFLLLKFWCLLRFHHPYVELNENTGKHNHRGNRHQNVFRNPQWPIEPASHRFSNAMIWCPGSLPDEGVMRALERERLKSEGNFPGKNPHKPEAAFRWLWWWVGTWIVDEGQHNTFVMPLAQFFSKAEKNHKQAMIPPPRIPWQNTRFFFENNILYC